MFDIITVEFENFKSYRGSHSFALPTTPGLYFLTGSNKAEPKLGSNGSGKSTLLDAIYWCLYGRTLRGLKATDVINWKEKSCSVSLELTVGQNIYVLTRTQNPNSLILDGKTIDQTELQKHIIIGDEAFTYSVILPQFGQSFFELTPANKLTLFSQIMGLDYWLECSQRAAIKATALQSKIDIWNAKIGETKTTITSTKTGMAQWAEKEANFNEELEATINHIEREIDESDLYIADMKIGLQSGQNNLKKADEARLKKADELQVVETTHEKYMKRRESLNIAYAAASATLLGLEAAYGKLSGLGPTCPTCLQTVNAKHLKAERMIMTKEMASQKTDLDEIGKQSEEVNRFVTKTSNSVRQILSEISTIDREAAQARNIITKADAEMRAEIARKATLKESIEIEKGKPNPYSAIIAEKQALLKELKSKLNEDSTLLAKTQAEHEAVSFWVTGFKRLRLSLIENTLRALELEVNNSLTTLGLTDWQIEFDVERENKSGGITKGFTVFIRNSTHPEPVRFEAWSGGETKRLQLAGDLGLANLIMLQAGLTNTIEFYDEPSNHLSQEGLLDLAETLYQRAINDNKRILMVDHHNIDFGDFAGVIKVTKTEEGSSLEYEHD